LPPEPESIALHIVFEDDDLIVVNKPVGMVVHPSPGHSSKTLVNALLYHRPDIRHIGEESRSGIVHRLDKDTSGVILIAKTQDAHKKISSDFKTRQHIQKKYLALVFGRMDQETGKIDLPLGRHPVDRKKMSVSSKRPKNAETLWTVKEEYSEVSLLKLVIKTGRTHQIRVHCAAIHHPVVGDLVYGSRKTINRIRGKDTRQLIQGISRQMLHAWKLSIIHPRTEERMSFEAPVPKDMADVMEGLRGA
jgi:23S rRNA pseudouridine1911/1915/1917 synthase